MLLLGLFILVCLNAEWERQRFAEEKRQWRIKIEQNSNVT